MTVTVRDIMLADYRYDIQVMLEGHANEVTHLAKLREVDVDFEAYLEAERSGHLFCLGVFYKEFIVGYAAMVIRPHPHAQKVTICTTDALFLRPEFRAGRNGLALIEAIKVSAKQRGADILMIAAKTQTALERILPRIGFSADEVVYAMEF